MTRFCLIAAFAVLSAAPAVAPAQTVDSAVSKALPEPKIQPPLELKEVFAKQTATGHFVPNSMPIMQRKPRLVRAFRQLSDAVFEDEPMRSPKSTSRATAGSLAGAILEPHAFGERS